MRMGKPHASVGAFSGNCRASAGATDEFADVARASSPRSDATRHGNPHPRPENDGPGDHGSSFLKAPNGGE